MTDRDEDQGITAYHGSPHEFEQFDLSKIGTGEGAQAYGHGLYFAESEPIAQSYRDNLLGRGTIMGGGADDLPDRWQMAVYEAMKKPAGEIREYAINTLRSKAPPEYSEQINKLLSNKGHMYEVSINAHPDHFLDWDKPLNKQSGHVQSVLDVIENHPIFTDSFKKELKLARSTNYFDGESLYGELGIALGDKEASKFLHDNGIKGIKYLDAGSRGKVGDPDAIQRNLENAKIKLAEWKNSNHPNAAEQRSMYENEVKNHEANLKKALENPPTRNYVVFDDKLVNVKRRYARGGMIDGDELQKAAHAGRNGDTILAHINPQEAALLRRMGGSGTINPHTGLPEFAANPGDIAGGGFGSGNVGGGSSPSYSGNGGMDSPSESGPGPGMGGGGGGNGGGSDTGGGLPSVGGNSNGGNNVGQSAAPREVMPGFGGGAGAPAQPAASGRPAGATEGEMVSSEPGIGIGQNIGASYLKEALTPDLSGGAEVMSPNLGVQNGVLMGGMTPSQFTGSPLSSQSAMLQGMGIKGGPTTAADLSLAAQAARLGDVPNAAQAEAAPKGPATNPLSVSETPGPDLSKLTGPWVKAAEDAANWIAAGFKTPAPPPATVTRAAPTQPKEQGPAPGSPSASLLNMPNAGDLYGATSAPLAVGQMPSATPMTQPMDTGAQDPSQAARAEQMAQTAREAYLAANFPESPRLGDLAQPTPAAPFATQNRAGSMGSMPLGASKYGSDMTLMSSQPAFPHTQTPFSGYPQDVQRAMIPTRPDSAFRTGKQIDPTGAQTQEALQNLEVAQNAVTMMNAPGFAGGLVRMFMPTPTEATPQQQAAIERMYRGTLEGGVPADFATETQMLRDYGYPTGTTPQRAGSMGSMPSGVTQYGSDLTPAYTDSGQRAGSIGSMPQSSVGTGTPLSAYEPNQGSQQQQQTSGISAVRADFNKAFAEHLAAGDKVFTWTNPLTGVTSTYTTQLARKEGGRVPSTSEPEAWIAQPSKIKTVAKKTSARKPSKIDGTAIVRRAIMLSSHKS